MEDTLMKPKETDTSITIPVTFDYRGGRGSNLKGKIIATTAIIVISIIISIGLFFSDLNALYKLGLIVATLYIGLLLLRYVVYREQHFSDIYEELLAKDFQMDITSLWQIFEVEEQYPYICYFKNGQKGLFVRMEMGTITGKSETVMYDHYEAISDAYNMAHSLNMNMIHIDYMDNVGNDDRLKKLYNDLYEVKNPEMRSMLIDIYDNIQEEMTRNYANYDIYLFLTRDRIDNFTYNVQNVCSKMTEGNFITYRIMDSTEIATTVKALFNLHEFSVLDANEATLLLDSRTGIVPLAVYHADGSVDKLNQTQEEKRIQAQVRTRRLKEEMAEKKANKRRRKNHKKGIVDPSENINVNEQLDIFGVSEGLNGQQPQQINGNNSQMFNMNQPPLGQPPLGQSPINQSFTGQQPLSQTPLGQPPIQNQSFSINKQQYSPSQQLVKNGQVINNQQNGNNTNNLFN